MRKSERVQKPALSTLRKGNVWTGRKPEQRTMDSESESSTLVKPSHRARLPFLPPGKLRTGSSRQTCSYITFCFCRQEGSSLWNTSSETADFSPMINEVNYVLFLKCVEDSSCGLPPIPRIRAAEQHIWLEATSSLGGSPAAPRATAKARKLEKLLLSKNDVWFPKKQWLNFLLFPFSWGKLRYH